MHKVLKSLCHIKIIVVFYAYSLGLKIIQKLFIGMSFSKDVVICTMKKKCPSLICQPKVLTFKISILNKKKLIAHPNLQVMTCSSCTDDAAATSWCVECAEYICDSCVQAHQRLKITKDHTIKTKEEAITESQSTSNDEKTLMCHVHPQVNYRFICKVVNQYPLQYLNVILFYSFNRRNCHFSVKLVTD